ncbi:MAG: TetR/AcrR family transcriptional regulator [Chitinophagaceae bacterium]
MQIVSLSMATAKRKKASKKDFILRRAAAMFSEKGYSATSMRDLADAVGIEAASLYNHIQSKAEILQEIIFRMTNDCNVHIGELEKGKLSNIKKVESLIRFHVQMMMYQCDDYTVMINEWMHLPEPYLTNFNIQRRQYVVKMEKIITDGFQQGEMKNIAPYVAVLTLLSSVRGLEFWHRSSQKISPQKIEDDMVNFLIKGLKKN